MTMPNFIGIGAAKGGTTALYRYLKQHPQVYMSSQKELRFFPFDKCPPDFRGPGDEADGKTIVTDIEQYRSFFADGAAYPARGEISPLYLYYPRAAERIHHYLPDAKMIAILRQPAERAYSQFLMMKREGLETLDFDEVLSAEEHRIANHWGTRWHYRRRGFYSLQLKPYLGLFKRAQIRIYLYDDYIANPLGLIQDIFRFVQVDDTFVPDMSTRHNESKIPRNNALNLYLTHPRVTKNILKHLIPSNIYLPAKERINKFNQTKEAAPEDVLRALTEEYHEDIIKLQDIIQRDLSHWLFSIRG